jgi:hypothetical protein
MTAKVFNFEEVLEAKQKEKRQKESEQVIFDDVDALIDFIHDWLESILTKREMLIVASRIEDMENET